ncbi:MAG: hypothetical protein M3295_04185 [Chloroflexota bacterium]|nr:hypothetical protein [Chloroflexota bacterium]
MTFPYTVFFPGDEALHPADLEHRAPLPRVGDTVEYIDKRGRCTRYVVRSVIHTLQASAGEREPVADKGSTPAAFARSEQEAPEIPGDGGSLRAGLPKVFLELAEGGEEGEQREVAGWKVIGSTSTSEG